MCSSVSAASPNTEPIAGKDEEWGGDLDEEPPPEMSIITSGSAAPVEWLAETVGMEKSSPSPSSTLFCLTLGLLEEDEGTFFMVDS